MRFRRMMSHPKISILGCEYLFEQTYLFSILSQNFLNFCCFFILYFLRKKIQFQKHLATSQRTPSILFGFISSKLIYKVFLKNFGCLTLFLFNKNENPISLWWIDLINQLVSSLPLLVGSTISNRPNKKLQGPTKPFWPCGRAATRLFLFYI